MFQTGLAGIHPLVCEPVTFVVVVVELATGETVDPSVVGVTVVGTTGVGVTIGPETFENGVCVTPFTFL